MTAVTASIKRLPSSSFTPDFSRQHRTQASLDHLQRTHTLNNSPSPRDLLPGHIMSSPYPTPSHTLDLSRVSRTSALFARALQKLAPTTSSYAAIPYQEVFDFEALFEELRKLVTAEAGDDYVWPKTSFYVVSFHSTLKDGIDKERLGLLDEKSHEEAVESGGLLKYWFGVPDAQRRTIATCFWQSREQAAEGGKGPWHKKARGAAATMYEGIRFETRRLTVEEGVRDWSWELKSVDHYGAR